MKGDGNSSRVTHMFPLPKKIMKVSKKLLAAIMAAAMVIPMGTASALAATAADGPQEQSTNVKYLVTEGYEWSIHSEVDFDKDKGVNQTVDNQTMAKNTVAVTKNVIADGKTLNITVKGSGDNGAFSIKNGNTVLSYAVKADNAAVKTGGTVLDVAAGTNTASKAMSFILIWH